MALAPYRQLPRNDYQGAAKMDEQQQHDLRMSKVGKLNLKGSKQVLEALLKKKEQTSQGQTPEEANIHEAPEQPHQKR